MTEVRDLLVADAEAALQREAGKLRTGSPLDRMLAAWLLPAMFADEARPGVLAALTQWRDANKGRASRTYKSVGALGLAVVLELADAEGRQAFLEGLDWALGTSPEIDGAPVGLAADPAAVLAVAVGLACCADAARIARVRAWLNGLVTKFGSRLGPWERAQLQVAAEVLGEDGSQPPQTGPFYSVVRAAVNGAKATPTPADARTIVASGLEHAGRVDPVGAALLLAAMHRARSAVVASIRVDALSLNDLLDLLRGVPRALQEWTWEDKPRTKSAEARKWYVDHEYHVQNLLWALLAPILPDLRREEFGAQVGLLQPRVDLAVPSMKLIIEAKFARTSDKLSDVQRQLAEDASLYFPQGRTYERMIAFVWDEGQRTEEHDSLVRGLEQLERIAGAVVVSRPGKMRSSPGVTG